MASVTVYSAEKMDEILDDGVDGATITGGHLILHKRDGTTVDAGAVSGSAASDASTTVKGIVELATDVETAAGSDTVRAVTPFGLAGTLVNLLKRTLNVFNLPANDVNSYIAQVTIVDDGSTTTNWVDRLVFKFKDFASGLTRNTFYLNEYGEIRISPAKYNTVGFRAFVKDQPTNPTEARSTTIPVLEMMDDRTTRTSLWGVLGDGTVTCKNGIKTAYTIVLGPATAVPTGTPAGTVIVRTVT